MHKLCSTLVHTEISPIFKMSNSYPRCYPDGGRRGSSKQKHVHQQLIQLKSAAAAIEALETTPAARVLTLNSRISECTRRWSGASSCGLQFWLRCRRTSRSLSLLQCCMPRACSPVCKPLTSRRARAHFEFANFRVHARRWSRRGRPRTQPHPVGRYLPGDTLSGLRPRTRLTPARVGVLYISPTDRGLPRYLS